MGVVTLKKITGFLISLLMVATSLISGESATANVGHSSIDLGLNVLQLEQCQTPSELDCIQSIEAIDQDGTVVSANPITGSSWKIESYFFNGFINPNVTLETPEHLITVEDGISYYGGALRLDISIVNSRDIVLAPKVLSGSETFPSELLGISFRIAIRTSWLKPQNVQLVADNADFSQTAIAGGNLWTFSGTPVHASSYDWSSDSPEKQNFSANADSDSLEFHFFIHHAGVDEMHSYFPPTCADLGYTVQAFNSNSAGSPEWNDENRSLDLRIFAPHTTTSGALNKGFFKLWTTDDFINCRWPQNTLTSGGYLTAEIKNDDGTSQTASVEVVHENGKVFLDVQDFHYSAPTIQLKSSGTNGNFQKGVSAPLKKFKYASKPKISGIARAGKTLKAIAGKWDKSVKLTYAWFRNGVQISGARKSSYKLISRDKKKRISVVVTGRKLGYVHVSKSSSRLLVR